MIAPNYFLLFKQFLNDLNFGLDESQKITFEYEERENEGLIALFQNNQRILYWSFAGTGHRMEIKERLFYSVFKTLLRSGLTFNINKAKEHHASIAKAKAESETKNNDDGPGYTKQSFTQADNRDGTEEDSRQPAEDQ